MIKDFLAAVKNTDSWIYLAYFDIKSKYRRTVLGPFWLVLVSFISIGCIGAVSSILFKAGNILDFLPYVAGGIISWNYVTSIINESCSIYITNSFIIQNVKTNLITLSLRMLIRNTIIFFHSLVTVLIFILIKHGFFFNILLLVPAIFMYIINGVAVAIYIGFMAARFRDIAQIIQVVLSILIFVTPVMWKRELLANYDLIAYLNPFTHFIALIREPLLRNIPTSENIIIVSGTTLINIILASYIYKRFNKRLVFWL